MATCIATYWLCFFRFVLCWIHYDALWKYSEYVFAYKQRPNTAELLLPRVCVCECVCTRLLSYRSFAFFGMHPTTNNHSVWLLSQQPTPLKYIYQIIFCLRTVSDTFFFFVAAMVLWPFMQWNCDEMFEYFCVRGIWQMCAIRTFGYRISAKYRNSSERNRDEGSGVVRSNSYRIWYAAKMRIWIRYVYRRLHRNFMANGCRFMCQKNDFIFRFNEYICTKMFTYTQLHSQSSASSKYISFWDWSISINGGIKIEAKPSQTEFDCFHFFFLSENFLACWFIGCRKNEQSLFVLLNFDFNYMTTKNSTI